MSTPPHDANLLKMARKPLGPAGRMAQAFVDSKLTPLLVVASLALGFFAVAITPREEEPQIKVPMIDVLVPYPGASAREVEERVSTPLEKLVWEIPGVEYVYTTSSPNFGMAVVRFKVGQDPEQSLVKLYTKIMAHPEKIPPGAGPPLVQPKSIDDVPIVALTLWSRTLDSFRLRQVAGDLALEVKKIPDIAEVELIGGERREIRVTLDPDRLRAYGASALSIAQALGPANRALPAGSFSGGNREVILSAGKLLRTVDDVRAVVVGVRNGRTVRLGDVARVTDGPSEPSTAVLFSTGPQAEHKGISGRAADLPAVTIAVSKRRGSNAVILAKQVEEAVRRARESWVPSDVEVTVTRDYGETAKEKSNELISHVLIATAAVVGLILLALGRREALVVAVVVPVTLSLTLAVSYLFGYTLNRVTLFALIFAIGILVDDAIVVVENIHRHFQLGWTGRKAAAVYATDEVGNPTILATFTVIASLLPLAFVSGLMGPYMRPIPVNASAAMFFSLLVAFVITPWIALRVLGAEHARRGVVVGPASPEAETPSESRIERAYSRVVGPMIHRPRLRNLTLGAIGLLLLASFALVGIRAVRVKMLPYDNKSEFQVIVDMPEGSTLEETRAAASDLAAVLREHPDVTDIEAYVGTSGPINFNGLVRHYFLRRGPNVADLQVNLAGKHDRRQQSHAIAKQVRPLLLPVAEKHGANIKVAEVPPGPPVLSTMVAEVYGPDLDRQVEVAAQIKTLFETTEGIVDVDWYVEDPQPKVEFRVDPERAALAGVTPEMVAQKLSILGYGMEAGLLHDPAGREPVPIFLRMARAERHRLADLGGLTLHAPDGRMVPVAEVVDVVRTTEDRSIYHKNLRRVVYVTGEVAGAQESPIYGVLNLKSKIAALALPEGYEVEQHYAAQPSREDRLSMKWDGEWQITYEVGRDMGIAFAVVMLLVYVLVVAWFGSFVTPLIIMAPIPLTLVGILPGHWMLGMFFTATSMIGFIALAGIIVRNSILLVDFVNLELESGTPLEKAVVKAGAVRLRPIVLTAMALVAGGFVMILDPIFQGLAVSLIFGVLVSTALTLIVIPLLYYLYLRGRQEAGPSVASTRGAGEPVPAGS
jgi:multidrug efflux pump subunit AcrB